MGRNFFTFMSSMNPDFQPSEAQLARLEKALIETGIAGTLVRCDTTVTEWSLGQKAAALFGDLYDAENGSVTLYRTDRRRNFAPTEGAVFDGHFVLVFRKALIHAPDGEAARLLSELGLAIGAPLRYQPF